MKIHILFEKGVKKKSINWVINEIKEQFENNFVGVHIDKPFHVTFTQSESKIKHEYMFGGKQSEGRNYYLTDMYFKLKDIPDCDAVCYLYNNTFKTSGFDYVAPNAKAVSLNGIHYFEIPTDFETQSYHAPSHELMHILCFKLSDKGFIPRGVSDNMDSTYINGVLHTYYKNSTPLAKDGNYAITFKHIKPFLDYVTGETKASLLQKLQAQLLSLQLELQKKTATSEPYKYFKLNEPTGQFSTVARLNPELVHLLDKARDLAGVPFVITSGYRDEAYNKKVGGAKDSAHLKGLAVDIRFKNSVELFAIVNGLLKAGFNRIGISFNGNFVHVDIDNKKQPMLIWGYE